MGTAANTINATISPNLNFDFAKDFAPIALVASVPNMLVAHPSLGVDNLQELIALAKQSPSKITYGSSGVATTTHLAGELINVMAGVKLVHVPYPGSAQALTDVLTGRIDLLFAPASAVIQHVEKGEPEGDRGDTAPARRHRAERADHVGGGASRLRHRPVVRPAGAGRHAAPEIDRQARPRRQRGAEGGRRHGPLRKAGLDPLGGTPDEFASYIASEIKKGATVAQAAGIKK